MTAAIAAPTLQTISLAQHESLETLAKALYDACTVDGFIYLSDHGIPQAQIDQAFATSAKYFSQASPDDKIDLKSNLGYTAVRQEALDSTMASAGDLKESFHIADLDWYKANGLKQDLPKSLDESRDLWEAFISNINRVAFRVLQALALALQLPEDYLTKNHRGELNRLRLIHYPAVGLDHKNLDASIPDIRAGAHTDYGSITCLFQHHVSGLQVLRDDVWLDVAPQQGCLVINIGDALEFWSGGRFKSTLHRVVMPRNQSETASRYTMAYFVHPDTNSILEPLVNNTNEKALEEIIARKGLPKGTRKITGGDYVHARLSATYAK